MVAAERDGDLEFAADFAADEIERLSGVRPPRVDLLEVLDEHFAVFFQLRSSEDDGFDESYRLSSSEGFVRITASSKCGLLFAVGRLLRLCSFRAGELEITIGLDLEFRPKSRIRSHQIGYGHSSNSMDSWAVAQFDRYIRDLILFGCNAIEIEYKPDDSPHSCDLLAIQDTVISDPRGVNDDMGDAELGRVTEIFRREKDVRKSESEFHG